ncbi:TonB-dependent receptor [Dyella solisilvae]|uniref:TonB-dependent receptor n=1 Tax=Dyella solisilvae TaxID=1920168 RepID=A0A370KAX5_9GAMM|nr:TonB-dependent receptor [Dyella solisilvae]RDI99808.1 TonB-dependent receptor [Dyella solisilvae]
MPIKDSGCAGLPRRRWLSLSISCLLTGLPLTGHTQSSPANSDTAAPATANTPSTSNAVNLNRIVVTAQKREQQVVDVPISISAFSGNFLKTMGLTRMEDLARYVPGVQIQVQSPNNPGFAVRGITTDDGSANAPSRVSIFQDGVDISRSRGSVVALYDMDRIEVLRGPQGTLFGRGAESGAISLIQNKAQDNTSGAFTTEFGNFNSRLLTGYFNTPISSSVDARVAVYDSEHDGYIKNLSGGSLNGEDTKAIRASLHIKTGDQSGIDLIANYQRDAPPGTDFRSATVPTRNGSTDVFGPADLNEGDALGIRRKVYGLTALGNFVLSDSWSLSTVTGLRKFDSLETFDADGSQVDMLNFQEHSKSHQASQEVRFNFDNGGRFTGFMGANFFYENGSQAVPFNTDERSLLVQLVNIAPSISPASAPIIKLLFGPNPIPLLTPDFQPNQPYSSVPLLGYPLNPDEREGYENYGSTRSYEAFADGTFHVTDQFDLTGGLRLSHEKITAGYQVFNSYGPYAAGIGPALTLLGVGVNGITEMNDLFPPTGGKLTNEESTTSVVGRLIGSYRFGDDTNAYLSVSRGRRPNVLAFNINTNGVGYYNAVLPAEILWNYEAGLKGAAANGNFLYDLSAFYYSYTNFQSQVIQGGRYVTVNSGRAHSPGFEASLQQLLGEHASVFLNYSYLHARFDDTDQNGNPQQYAGNHLRLAPDNSVALGLLLNFPLDDSRAVYVRPSYTWRSKVYFEDDNNPNYVQPAYGLFNLRTGITFDHGRWDLGLWGNNLSNKKYLIDAGNSGETFGLPTYIPGSPRTYGVSISGKF